MAALPPGVTSSPTAAGRPRVGSDFIVRQESHGDGSGRYVRHESHGDGSGRSSGGSIATPGGAVPRSPLLLPAAPPGGRAIPLASPSSPSARLLASSSSPSAGPNWQRSATFSSAPATSAWGSTVGPTPRRGPETVATVVSTPKGSCIPVESRQKPPSLSFHVDSPPGTPLQTSGLADPTESDDELVEDFSWMKALWPTPRSPSGTEPRIGIDIGGVLTRDGDPGVYPGSEWTRSWEAPGALEAVRRIACVFGKANVYLVSKARHGGAMYRRMETWLHDTCRFCAVTGVPKENIVFVPCIDGPFGKGAVSAKLGLSHFVDDKLDVLTSVYSDKDGNSGHLVELHQGILFHFAKGGNGSAPTSNSDEIGPRMRRYLVAVGSWSELLQKLHQKLPAKLKMQKNNDTDILIRQDVGDVGTCGPATNPSLGMSTSSDFSFTVPKPLSGTAPSAVLTGAPALQLDPAGGRPKLILKKREEPTPCVEQTSKPALQVDPAGGRPKLVLKKREERAAPAPAIQQPVPAVQRDASGRPKLVLKPRTTSMVSTSSDASPVLTDPPPQATPIPTSVTTTQATTTSNVLGGSQMTCPANASRNSATSARGQQPLQQSASSASSTRPAPPALQRDPDGGRPKLNLMPRTIPTARK